jgi:hypothetical protein
VTVAVALIVGGCGGGGDGDKSDARPRGSAGSTSTTAASARIDLSQPIPGGSLHDTPRPPLENTGDDYVAIFESLDANFRWLTENPDPAVVSELYAPGTTDHDYWVPAFDEFVTKGWRAADDGYFVVSTEVVSALPNAVSLRVEDSMVTERIVDDAGTQVGEERVRDPQVKTWTVLLAVDEAGRWRFADWERVDIPVQV